MAQCHYTESFVLTKGVSVKKICVFTGSRAEYGLLKSLMQQIDQDPCLHLQTLVGGMHLSPEFGLTFREIEQDGFAIDEKVELLLSSDSPIGICKSTGLGLIGFGEALERLSPDLLVVLGDRFETWAVCAAALFIRIPIAHLHGGEKTEGAADEAIRHGITKMSHLHFVTTEDYRRRVIQLGEQPERVFNVGAPGVESINKLTLLDRSALEAEIGFNLGPQNALVTFHPVTLETATAESQFGQLLAALADLPELHLIFTRANADTDGRIINQMIDDFVAKRSDSAAVFSSLGQLRYLSAMKQVDVVLGNSSSGIIEAPSFGVPTVNIGARQHGRVRAASVIDCMPEKLAIREALDKALSKTFKNMAATVDNPYDGSDTSLRIKECIKEVNLQDTRKAFFDLPIDFLEQMHAKRQENQCEPDDQYSGGS
jgi:GDP/UDP-N,N'-diacetylbacillosamine 2-epimerase (hydrolysing)